MATDYLALMQQNKNTVPSIGATTVAQPKVSTSTPTPFLVTQPPVVKANTTPTPTTGATITSSNTKNVQPIVVTQPTVATGNAILQSDIISKGQADTARAVAEEAKIAQNQGQTSVANTLANYVKTTTPANTQTTPVTTTDGANTGNKIDVGGVTAETVAQQKQQVADSVANQTGETALTSQAYANTVDPAQQELNAINQQINEEALASRRRKEAVLLLPGITQSQAQDKLNEMDRVSTSKLADLSIIQMAKQGQYDSAKTIADRLVQAKLEDQKNKNNALLFTYQENKELFTKAEQRQFDQAHDDRERNLNAEEKNLQRISDLSLQALQDGAPASVVTKMRNAKTEAEAISLGGSYIGALDRKVKLANIAQSNAATAASKQANRNTIISNTTSSNPKYAGALSVILGSEKFTKEQKTAVVNAVNNGQDPVAVIKNQAKNVIGATEATKLTNYEVARDTLKDIKTNLDLYYSMGGKTNIFKGNIENVTNKLGGVNDPNLVGLATQISSQLQVYRNAVSGTAYSVQEGQEISKVFPGINKTEGLNKAITDGRLKAFNSTIDSTYKTVLGDTYEGLKKTEELPVSNPFSQSLGITPTTGQSSAIFNSTIGYVIPK